MKYILETYLNQIKNKTLTKFDSLSEQDQYDFLFDLALKEDWFNPENRTRETGLQKGAKYGVPAALGAASGAIALAPLGAGAVIGGAAMYAVLNLGFVALDRWLRSAERKYLKVKKRIIRNSIELKKIDKKRSPSAFNDLSEKINKDKQYLESLVKIMSAAKKRKADIKAEKYENKKRS